MQEIWKDVKEFDALCEQRIKEHYKKENTKTELNFWKE